MAETIVMQPETVGMQRETVGPVPDRWSPVTRAVVSAGIILYLAGVIVPPLAGPPPFPCTG